MVKLPCVTPQSCPRNFERGCTQRRAAHPHGIKVPDALANQLRFRGRDGRLKVAALYTFHVQRRSREIGGPDAGWLPVMGYLSKSSRKAGPGSFAWTSRTSTPRSNCEASIPSIGTTFHPFFTYTSLISAVPIHNSRYTPTIRSTTSR